MPVAMVGARRYRLSRTSWRGIRFSFRGRVGDFMCSVFVVGNDAHAPLDARLCYPICVTHRQKFMVSHAWFGSRKFDFDGRGRELVWPVREDAPAVPAHAGGSRVVLVLGAPAPLLHRVTRALARRASTPTIAGRAAGLAADHQRRGARRSRSAWRGRGRPPATLHFTNRISHAGGRPRPAPPSVRTRAPPPPPGKRCPGCSTPTSA